MEGRGKRGKGEAKDAAGALPMEEDVSSETRISTVEKELNDLKEDLSEIKALLKTLTEGVRGEKKARRAPVTLPEIPKSFELFKYANQS